MFYKKTLGLFLLIFTSFSFLTGESESNHFEFSADFNGAYDFESDYISSEDESHYAPITGPYSTIEAALSLNASYIIPKAKTNLTFSFQITPLSLMPSVSAKYTPFPFLVLGAGLMGGSGWNLGSIKGFAEYDAESASYEDLTFMRHFYYQAYANAILQMDTGYIFPGPWNHVVALFCYRVLYAGLTGTEDKAIWNWQSTGLQADGFQEYIQAVLAYQMPLLIKRAGIMFEMKGHYSSSDYDKHFADFDGDFRSIRISPLLQAEWGARKEHSLALLFCFYSRRSFLEEHTKGEQEPFLTCTGREWFFERIAFSYSYSF